MVKLLKKYSLDENTNIQFETRLAIDFQDIKEVEEYAGNQLKVPENVSLCILKTYDHESFVVEGSFHTLSRYFKNARTFAENRYLFSIQN